MNDTLEPDEQGRYIGIVRRFRDNARNAKFGFINHISFGDIFFHENNIVSDHAPRELENEIVEFTPRKSSKHKGKYEAIQVKLLSLETDLILLFSLYLSFLSEYKQNIHYIHQSLDHIKITLFLNKKISLLLNNQADAQILLILFESFQTFVNNQLRLSNAHDLTFIKSLLNICKSFFPNHLQDISKLTAKSVPTEIAHILWLEDYIEACQVDYIATIILESDFQLQRKILNKCTTEEKSSIFHKCLSILNPIDTPTKYKSLKVLFELSKELVIDSHEHLVHESLKFCSVLVNVILWLDDFHQELIFNEYKSVFHLLKPSNQVKFVKKVLKYVHEQKTNISVEDLTSLNVVDYKAINLSQNTGRVTIDYSTSIMLNTILELKNQTQIENSSQISDAKNRIYDIILNQISDPADILVIRGYFDECNGRCTDISIRELQNDSGEVIDQEIIYQRNTYKKPHEICDGRKALLKDGTTAKDKLNVEFWWCANDICYKPSRRLHTHDEWENYTLLDFLTIFKVHFQEKDYETYLSIINKANRFLKHLKCRECNHMLRPTRQSNYAFYRINHFHCINDDCKNKEVEIYLTHCINSRCEHEIDSRDSVRCKPEGVDTDKFGWYVCTYCLACCSDDGIERRKYILHKTGQEYKGHSHGHKELGVISCDKCGYHMESNTIDNAQYQKALDWLIKDAEKSNSNVIKSGMNKHNKHWFRYSKANLSSEEYNNKLLNLLKLGFQIPDFDQKKDIHLISEPLDVDKRNRDVLTCRHCNYILDVTTDREREYAIKKYHSRYT